MEPPSGLPAPVAADRLPPAPPVRPGPALDPPRHRRARVVGLAVVAAAALIAGALGFVIGRDRREGREERADAPPVDAAALEDEVARISAFVEDTRGLDFEEPVDVEVLEPDAYVQRVRDDLAAAEADEADENGDDGDEDREEDVGLLLALGLWPEGEDPADVTAELTAVGSLGFYDPEADELVVQGGSLSPLVRITLAHELTHALEDQHFDLDRPDLTEANDESALTFAALVEGSAGRVEEAFRATLTDEERAEESDAQLEAVEGIDVSQFPLILLAAQQFQYGNGREFVESIVDDGGNAELDEAYGEPPTTSEQILEPAPWPGRQRPDTVARPDAEGAVVEAGVAGQLLLHLLIDPRATLLGGEDTTLPEWDGDRYVLWREGDDWCARIAVEGDTEAFDVAFEDLGDDIERSSEIEGGRVVLTSCR